MAETIDEQIHICTTCSAKFKKYHFDIEQDKCILHCQKTEENGWYKLNKEKDKKWNEKKLDHFWACIQRDLDIVYQGSLTDEDFDITKLEYKNVIFPKFQVNIEYNNYSHNLEDMGTNFYSFSVFDEIIDGRPSQTQTVNQVIQDMNLKFEECVFLDAANFRKYTFKKAITFYKCIFYGKVLSGKYKSNILYRGCDFKDLELNVSYKTFEGKFGIIDCDNLHNLNLKESTFKSKVKIQSCNIKGKANFYNTKFKDLADFYDTEFNDVDFERTDFNDISIFSECGFKKAVDFKYTKFLGKAIFRDAVFYSTLNLRNSIFDDDALFLDVTSEEGKVKGIQVANRETARVIKNFLDGSNNIIEANKFYALEMNAREKELNITKNPIEWLVFKIHGLSSNHSQDWLLSLLWIFVLTIYYSISDTKIWLSYSEPLVYLFWSVLLIPSFFNISIKYKKIILFGFISSVLYFTSMSLDLIAKTIHPFTKFEQNLSFFALAYKIIIAYLIYQFVVSIRQNTRRK